MYLPAPRPTRAASTMVLIITALVFGGILYLVAGTPRQPTIREEVKNSPPLSYIQKCMTLNPAPTGVPVDDPKFVEADGRYKQCIAAYRP